MTGNAVEVVVSYRTIPYRVVWFCTVTSQRPGSVRVRSYRTAISPVERLVKRKPQTKRRKQQVRRHNAGPIHNQLAKLSNLDYYQAKLLRDVVITNRYVCLVLKVDLDRSERSMTAIHGIMLGMMYCLLSPWFFSFDSSSKTWTGEGSASRSGTPRTPIAVKQDKSQRPEARNDKRQKEEAECGAKGCAWSASTTRTKGVVAGGNTGGLQSHSGSRLSNATCARTIHTINTIYLLLRSYIPENDQSRGTVSPYSQNFTGINLTFEPRPHDYVSHFRL